MKNLYSFRKANLFTLASVASLLFLFSCSEDTYQEEMDTLETTNVSQAMSSSSAKINVPKMTASATKSGYSAANANDNSYSTKWRADGTAINLIADLGSTKPVDFIKVSHSSGTSRKYYFEIWTKENSTSSWVRRGQKTSPGNSSSTVAYDISNINARYIRLKCNGNNVNNRNEVKKFEVWGSNSGTTSSSGGSSTGSGTFQLGQFGIETTKSCSSSTSTSTLSDTELEDGETYTKNDLDYYERDGSKYILRSCPQKSRRTEWKQSSSFALNGGKKMSYKAKFQSYPSGGVTIAQVHNRGGAQRPLLRIEIKDGKVIFINSDTYIKNTGTAHVITGPKYNSGEEIEVSLEATNDKIIAYVKTDDGAKTATYQKTSSDIRKVINNIWFSEDITNGDTKLKDGFYFKAGVYNDSGNGSNSPVATFSEFKYQG